ncbi:MAG: hypothetical protein EXR18_04630 [Flavobacteriaceae bacterium]|nr:hypothetical protein [Flavobacteriaceae bacterium]
MTKQERKLKYMLNYFEVDLKGVRDEKLSKKEKYIFVDRFLQIYDSHILHEILQKIKEQQFKEKDFEESDEEDDFIIPPDYNSEKSDNIFGSGSKKNNSPNDWNDPINTDINKFLKWLTLILYSGNHSVIISEDKNTIYIKLIKINKDKGKK